MSDQMKAPSVTIEDVEKAIIAETYTLLPNGRTTVCQLTLFDNGDTGFTVEGQSACVSKANYNEELGNKYARQRALDKVWEVLGYDLAKRLDTQRKLEGETFKDRLLKEKSNLHEKLMGLEKWLASSHFSTMSIDEQQDQIAQHEAMKMYYKVLTSRMTRLGLSN